MEKKITGIIRMIGDIGEKASRMLGGDSDRSLETDILLEEIRNLYREVLDLQDRARQKAASTGPLKGREEDAEEISGKAADLPEGSHKSVKKGSGEKEKAPPAEEPDSSGEIPLQEKAAGSAGPGKGSPAKAESPPAGKQTEPSILADKYRSDQKFINESLADARNKKDISSQIQSKPIQNIHTALGVNDRFKLIKELFNGDRESFEKTVGILDGASNFNEAFSYMSTTFDWDMEEESVQLLLDLVRRKFIVNQDE